MHEPETIIEKIILANAEVARAMGRRYWRPGLAVEDLEYVAYLAWAQAAQTFDSDRGEDFAVFAVAVIHREIKRWLRSRGWSGRALQRSQ